MLRRAIGGGPAALVLAFGGLASCDAGSPDGAGPLRVESVIGETGLSPGQFVYPRAVDAGGGAIWVIDKTARVQGFDRESGALVGAFEMPESRRGKPTGVTVAPGPDGTPALYVPDTHYHRVLVFAPPSGPGEEARLLASFGEYGTGPGQFIYPTDVAVLAGEDGLPERIYVSEYGGNDRISAFGAGHEFLFEIGGGDGVRFDRPQSIGIDHGLGELVVTDAVNHRIGRFTLDGELVGWLGSAGEAPGSLAYPYGLWVAGNGTALVSEFGNARVQHVDLESGECLGVWGVAGREVGELMSPWGVTVAGGTVYVLDSGNDRVVAFSAPAGTRKVAG